MRILNLLLVLACLATLPVRAQAGAQSSLDDVDRGATKSPDEAGRGVSRSPDEAPKADAETPDVVEPRQAVTDDGESLDAVDTGKSGTPDPDTSR